MAIKAEFLAGVTEKRVSPLYQWDYGQTLEIESPDLSPIIEVHFACPDMKEAVVHTCSVDDGVAIVTIPDRCLEQSNLITAWVYELDGLSGATTKVVYIPVVARTRPSRNHEIPIEVSDKYTELIGEVNKAVERITQGQVVVASAAKATSADRAAHADNASSAAHAESATFATNAGSAGTASAALNATYAEQAILATNDKDGRDIANTYMRCDGTFMTLPENTILGSGMYQFKVLINDVCCWAMLPVEGTNQASLGWIGDSTHYVLRTSGGTVSVWMYGSIIGKYADAVIYYRKINNC